MSDGMSDDQLDARLRAFLVRRAEEIAADAPPSDVVALRLMDRARSEHGPLAWWRNQPSAVRVAIALALTLAAVAALAIAASRLTPRPPTNGPITFLDGANIVIVNADGSGQRTLTTAQPSDVGSDCCWAAYSADGSMLLVGSSSSIEVMNADGSERRDVMRGVGLGGPVWSPDGHRIAAASAVQGFTQIFVVDIDGGSPEQVTHGLVYAGNPAWSHDGKWLAFAGARTTIAEQALFVVAADGTGLRQVGPEAPDGLSLGTAAWSPDDRSIAFEVGSNDVKEWHIDMVAADGTAFRPLLPAGLEGFAPAWSPSGVWIAFTGWPVGGQSGDLYIIRPDGTDPRKLAVDVSSDHPWSPDGAFIAFAHQLAETIGGPSTGYADLREIRPDGTGEHIVAAHQVNGTIAWPPASH